MAIFSFGHKRVQQRGSTSSPNNKEQRERNSIRRNRRNSNKFLNWVRLQQLQLHDHKSRSSIPVHDDLSRSRYDKPEGKVIKEKKSFKDITKKIPGYYDGKPSPLGFPVEEPPKMKNGFHPDLVDGKKVANRFNRLDPQSAKAMPKTGNPHIDKKVRAAAKKPK